ncbi:hypothetical protein [Kordia sp.]|uniref:hypothetical protein n=1 Tax=Kordia sp. TaxID=1965332 RepID=UPI0025BFDDE2|nr:hypothetical protein [Kordia sp.]MCH2195630.1 hypothetical protein [Kordia sp.]
MKNITFLFFFCSIFVVGQEKNQTLSKLEELIPWTHVMDMRIKDSKTKHFDFSPISHRIAEGSLALIDSINGTQVEIGSGAFTIDTYRDKSRNHIIKSTHSYVTHYNDNAESDLKGKSKRSKIDIYYGDEKPIFATYEKFFQLTNKKCNRHYYFVQFEIDNPSQKEVRDYILRLAKDQIANKK